jgi:hypothetical protein
MQIVYIHANSFRSTRFAGIAVGSPKKRVCNYALSSIRQQQQQQKINDKVNEIRLQVFHVNG